MGRVQLLVSLFAAVLVTIRAESEMNVYAPVLDMKDTDGRDATLYKGFIVTDEDTVSLVPELKASDKDEIGGARFICGYRLYADDYEVPFQAEVSSHLDGRAKLKVKPGVKLAHLTRSKYKFQIAAFDCGSPTLHSEKAHVIVQVLRVPDTTPPLPEDVKEMIDRRIEIIENKEELHMQTPPVPILADTTPTSDDHIAPGTVYPKLPLKQFDNGGEVYFDKTSYMVAMREGTLYDSVLKLRPAKGQSADNICGYEVLATGVPFIVDSQGNVKNTRALKAKVQKSYIIPVVAKHCDGLVSKPATVNIQVSEICSNGWKDLPVDEQYRAGTKAIKPFSKAWFDTCTVNCEQEETISVTVSLKSKTEINTCEHDTFSIQSQRESCGASPSTVDLLPQGKEWTESLTEVDGHEAAYKFDGKTAVNVPSKESNHTLSNFFTIATWMQHGEEKKDGHKEHILCNSDGNSMNRHHYALFVHNCRLVFLLRKEAGQVDSLDKFQPAEWRWTIPQVCDGKWHHYAMSVNYPEVSLFVDGQKIQTDKDIVEIVDDWALHPTNKVTFQQLSVGGCWKGETGTFGQFFDGSLAGLSLVTGTSESERVIKCMNSCGEKLSFHDMDLLRVGMSVSFNTELTEFTVRGDDPQDVARVLKDLGYTNTNGNPKPGYRTLHVNTNATCDGRRLEIPEQTIPVLVSAIADPKITVSGVKSKFRTSAEFASGVDVFTEIMILSAPDDQLKGQENRINKLDLEDVNQLQKDLKEKLLLDRCEVRANGKMDPAHEKLTLPTDLLVKYLLDTKEFNEGFDITGSESYAHYENVIRETFYVNIAANADFAGRQFTITCSDMNGKFISNPFTVELNVMTEKHPELVLYNDPEFAHMASGKLQSVDANAVAVGASSNVAAASGSSTATVVSVVVVCVALLLVVIVVAVIRIRNVNRTNQKSSNIHVEDGPEMEWDNSTLNITVNPLEGDSLMQELKSNGDEECDSEEEMMSSDDEDEHRDGGLEWDNSSY